MTSDPEPTLQEEARYLHDSLFAKPERLDEQTVERYEAVHRALFPNEDRSTVARVVSRRLDVEAVEFALRRRRSCPELTRKIQVLCYLIEIQAEYQGDFIASRREPARAILLLAGTILDSGWKLLKGECLVRMYGLL